MDVMKQQVIDQINKVRQKAKAIESPPSMKIRAENVVKMCDAFEHHIDTHWPISEDFRKKTSFGAYGVREIEGGGDQADDLYEAMTELNATLRKVTGAPRLF